jgi:hypothetical protein
VELTLEQQELVELAKRVPPADVAAAKRALEAIVDPFWLAMENLPYDDEGELTLEVIASLEEAKAEFARGECTPHEEILREFGLK